MLSAVLLVVWYACADASNGVYHVDRQDFSSPSPVARSLSYQNLVNGQPGVYKVNRQDFAGNAPFSENAAPEFGNMHGYYGQPKVPYPYEQVGNSYQPSYAPASSTALPRLFVPAESESAGGQPNYKAVLSLSEYNRRFETRPTQSSPSYTQPPARTTAPPYFQHPAQPPYYQSQAQPSYYQPPAQPSYYQPPAQSAQPSYHQPPAQPSYFQPPAPPLYHQPSVQPPYFPPPAQPTYTLPPTPQPSVSTYWPSSTTRSPSVTAPTTEVYSPLPQAGAEDDGILPPIQSSDDENKPLPAMSAQDVQRKLHVTEDAVGNRHTRVKYHSFDDTVEISDEHRELLESFGSIQNNESDFAELPATSPIRRRRNATHSQMFSVFSVRDSPATGAVETRPRDPEELIGAYMQRLWQQIEILDDMRKAVRDAKAQRRSTTIVPETIVAADDSTVIVFRGSAGFDSRVGNQAAESAEELSLPAPVAQFGTKVDANASEDAAPSSKESNAGIERSTEAEVAEASTVEPNLSEGSHEVLLQRDEGVDARGDPREQIVYLTEEPYKVATHSPTESWEDSE